MTKRDSLTRSRFLGTLVACILILAACAREVVVTSTPAPTPTPTPVPSDPLSVAKAYYEAFSTGDIEALIAIFADDLVLSFVDNTGHVDSVSGKAEVRAATLRDIGNRNPQISFSNPTVQGNRFIAEHSFTSESVGIITGTMEIVVEEGLIASIKVTIHQSPEPRTGPPPKGYVLADPFFQALKGAQAFYGKLEGTLYQIEMPNNWNRRLLLWAHGFQDFRPELLVLPPPFREYLIENGYAWAASSFSSNGIAPLDGTHETAALRDFFIQEFGHPDYTYITGQSMGGLITLLSLELFPRRYDGALAFCSVVREGIRGYPGHYLVLGAYVAGVTQKEFDAAESVTELVRESILPALESHPPTRDLFESLVTPLSGGPRPFRHEGFAEKYDINFNLWGPLAVESGLFDNTDFVYSGDAASGIGAEEVNSRVVRISGDSQASKDDFNFPDLTGAVPVPLLMLHTTGDGSALFSGIHAFRRMADAAGNGDLLVQRAIRAGGHCDFSQREMTTALEDLFNWVENGIKAEGEDILGPLHDVGLKFTDPLREGDPGGL